MWRKCSNSSSVNCALYAKAIVDGLGKNYANLQAVVKICQLFISELSTVIDSTNQILIPGAGIMERRHHGMSTGSPAHSLLTRPLSVHPVRPRLHSAISNGSLFAGYLWVNPWVPPFIYVPSHPWAFFQSGTKRMGCWPRVRPGWLDMILASAKFFVCVFIWTEKESNSRSIKSKKKIEANIQPSINDLVNKRFSQ